MISVFKRHFGRLSIQQIATTELEEAQRALLEAETGREYAESLVTYNRARIERLRRNLAELQKQPALTEEA